MDERRLSDDPALEAPGLEPGASRRILRNTGYRAVADVGSKLASIVLYVLIARRLGESAFGVFTFGLSFVTLVAMLGDLGQDRILTREVARDRAQLTRYFANTLALRVSVTLPVLLAVLAFSAAFGFDAQKTAVIALLGLAVIFELGISTVNSAYQAYERLEYIPVVVISQRVFTTAAAVVAMALGAGVVAVSAIYLAGAVLAFGIALLLLRRRIARPGLVVEPRRWLPMMRAALPVGIAGIAATVLFRIDTVMLAGYEADRVVGAYGSAYRLFETTLFLSWSVGSAVYPMFSRLTRRTDPPVGQVFERGVRLALALTLPLAVGAAVLAEGILRTLYGSAFTDAAGALRLLAVAIAAFPVAYIAGHLLVSQDRQIAMTITYGIVAVENILLNLYLIPRYSLDGAALGTAISETLVAIGLVAFARPMVGPIHWPRTLAAPLAASALAGTVMFLLRSSFFLAAGAGAAVYVVAFLVIQRVFFPGDLSAVLGLARGTAVRGRGNA